MKWIIIAYKSQIMVPRNYGEGHFEMQFQILFGSNLLPTWQIPYDY